MRAALKTLPQMALMAAIVATLAYVPLGVVPVLVLSMAGVPLDAMLTLGGTVPAALGPLLGWLLVYGVACGYAALLFPR
jgi:hypothetical protein